MGLGYFGRTRNFFPLFSGVMKFFTPFWWGHEFFSHHPHIFFFTEKYYFYYFSMFIMKNMYKKFPLFRFLLFPRFFVSPFSPIGEVFSVAFLFPHESLHLTTTMQCAMRPWFSLQWKLEVKRGRKYCTFYWIYWLLM